MSYVHHTILLLEDNPDDARFVRLALQRVGVITPVQTVSDSEQAQCYLGGQGCYADSETYPQPVLVLLDLIAQGSGLDFVAWLRQQPTLKRLPVVVLTSWIGGWLFFIQHQFEDAYWERQEKGKGTGEYVPMTAGDNAHAWVAYIVAF